jgi:hypothetical protein
VNGFTEVLNRPPAGEVVATEGKLRAEVGDFEERPRGRMHRRVAGLLGVEIMLNWVINWSLRHRLVVLGMMGVFVAIGLYAVDARQH